MLTAYLIRRFYRTHTYGYLVVPQTNGNSVFRTLELPWLENASNISCIPNGEYRVKYLPKSNSGKYKQVYHIQDVENRIGILIHKGNLPSHTRGCILIGTKIGILGNQPAVLNSATGLRQFRDIIQTDDFILKILEAHSVNN